MNGCAFFIKHDGRYQSNNMISSANDDGGDESALHAYLMYPIYWSKHDIKVGVDYKC